MSAEGRSSGRIAKNVYRVPFDGGPEALPGKDVVGSKAYNLMRIARRGLPVPPAFVLGTEICRLFMLEGTEALKGLEKVLDRELDRLGTLTGRYFGDARRPLLVSVRSGAPISMPGMMETVLNVGMNEGTLRGLVRITGNPRLAQDCRRRFVQQYGEVVHGIEPSAFERKLSETLSAADVSDVEELGIDGLRQISEAFDKEFEARTSKPPPPDPRVQLLAAIEAVLRSWSSERAESYRRLNGISHVAGTAVMVQAMAFGNLGPTSGAGVGFTRDPSTGADEPYVDYLPNAQGEDVVAGRRRSQGLDELERRVPEAFRSLLLARRALEREFADMQDFEFTVENGRFLLLQARAGKRTPLAALRIAHDMVTEGLVEPREALARLEGLDLDAIEEVGLEIEPDRLPLVRGVPAGAGVAIGIAAFDPGRFPILGEEGRPLVLFRTAADTSDIEALARAAALVAVGGARTSHAAVVARQLGKVCIVGCEGLSIDPSGRSARIGDQELREGDPVSVDGTTGAIYRGKLEAVRRRPVDLIAKVRSWQAAAPES